MGKGLGTLINERNNKNQRSDGLTEHAAIVNSMFQQMLEAAPDTNWNAFRGTLAWQRDNTDASLAELLQIYTSLAS